LTSLADFFQKLRSLKLSEQKFVEMCLCLPAAIPSSLVNETANGKGSRLLLELSTENPILVCKGSDSRWPLSADIRILE